MVKHTYTQRDASKDIEEKTMLILIVGMLAGMLIPQSIGRLPQKSENRNSIGSSCLISGSISKGI